MHSHLQVFNCNSKIEVCLAVAAQTMILLWFYSAKSLYWRGGCIFYAVLASRDHCGPKHNQAAAQASPIKTSGSTSCHGLADEDAQQSTVGVGAPWPNRASGGCATAGGKGTSGGQGVGRAAAATTTRCCHCVPQSRVSPSLPRGI